MFLQVVTFVIYIIAALCVGSIFVQGGNQKLKLFDLPIAIAMGLVIAGLLWVLAIISKVPPKVVVVSTMVPLAFFVVWKNRQIVTRLIDTSELKDVPYFCFAFLCFGGLTFIASIKMGQGEFPGMFFNMDSSLRLGHAWNMLYAKTYPPDSIFVLNSKHAYHYGAPAAVAAISAITRLSMHKAMFWVFCPILLLGTFSIFYRIVKEVCGNSVLQKVSLLLFTPFVLLASSGYELGRDLESFSNNLMSLIGISRDMYNSASYGNGVWDASVLAGFFLVAFSLLTSLHIRRPKALFSVVMLSILIVLYKMDMVIVIYVMLFVALWVNSKDLRFVRVIGLSVLMMLTPLILFEIFGYGGKQSEVQMLTINSLEEIGSIFDPRNSRSSYLLEANLVFLGMVLIIWNSYRSGRGFDAGCRFAVSIFAGITMCYVTVEVVDIPKTGGQFLLAMWIGSPLIATLILGSGISWRRPLSIIFLVPIVMVALAAQWNKLGHAAIAVWLPQLVEEYSDNEMLGEALSVIPMGRNNSESTLVYERYVDTNSDLAQVFNKLTNGVTKAQWGRKHFEKHGKAEERLLTPKVVVVTNDFRYLKWEDSQPVIPALFGHQAYSVHQRLFPGSGGYNVDAASKIWLQVERLSRKFSTKNKQFADETKKIASQKGWTHFLLKKDNDSDLQLRVSNTVPLKKIMENEIYAVFAFD